MTDERTGMDYLVLVERPYTETGTEQEVGVNNRCCHRPSRGGAGRHGTDPHAAVRAVMALILTRRCGPSWH